jgi:hypothetical protein
VISGSSYTPLTSFREVPILSNFDQDDEPLRDTANAFLEIMKNKYLPGVIQDPSSDLLGI